MWLRLHHEDDTEAREFIVTGEGDYVSLTSGEVLSPSEVDSMYAAVAPPQGTSWGDDESE